MPNPNLVGTELAHWCQANPHSAAELIEKLRDQSADAQNLIRQLMEQPVIEDTLYGRLARFRSKLPWAYELWVRRHLPGTTG